MRERHFDEPCHARPDERRPLETRSDRPRQRNELFHGRGIGAAALLLQAANRGDGGSGTAANAGDIRTLKALLLNGASKPAGWTHTATPPLDPQYGAGMVNVYQSWLELKAGNQAASASAPSGQLQTPVNLRLSSGWDLGSLPGGSTTNHYFFTAPASGGASDSLTATIAWNVSDWDSANNAILNNLDLALYDTTNTSSPVASAIAPLTMFSNFI